MEILWTLEAEMNYLQTLDYWDEHNGSCLYSDKIVRAIDFLIKELTENPYFLAKYDEFLNLYRRTILEGRFYVFYEIREDERIIEIKHFRSSRQKPLS